MRGVYLLAFLAALASFSGRASAGPLEELVQLAVHPQDPDVMVLRYEYGGEGLLYTRDGGASWRTFCGSALLPMGLDSPPARLGRVAFDAEGALHMGIFGGLVRDDGTGCAWTTETPFSDMWVSDVTNHPKDPSVLFAITSTGGDGHMNGVYRRTGSGGWEAVGAQDAILINRLHVVDLGGGKVRFYEGAVRGMLGTPPNLRPNYIIRVSDDLGETWTEHAFGDTDGSLRLEGVDPTNSDRLVVVVDHEPALLGAPSDPDQILVSEDQGATFTEWTRVVSFGGIALAPDGRVWFGDRGDPAAPEGDKGMYAAASLGAAPKLLNGDLQVACVGYTSAPERLFVCGRFDAGTVDPADGSYTRRFAFREVDEYIDCPAQDLGARCERQMLSAWCGISHFPEADVCCHYPAAAKGVDFVSLAGTDAGALVCPGDLDAGPGDAGALPNADAGAVQPDAAVAGTGGAGTGVAGNAAGKGDSGGCSCRAAGADARTPTSVVLAVALFGLALALARRRSRLFQ